MSCEPNGIPSMLRKLIPACCRWSIASHHDVDNRKEGNSTRSPDLTKSCGEKSMRRERKRYPTSCLVDEYSIYGREKDKTAILGLLLDCESSNPYGVCVISINGKGGVGKTTAAQLIYHDAKVVDFFELRLWIFVPEDFDVLITTRLILQAVTKENCEFKDDLNLLQLELKEKISGKRCLIILDDVLDVDSEQWDLLCKPFAAAHGVKVVVTTRNDGGQSIMGAAVSHYHLEGLSDDDCLSVFAHHAQGKAKFDAHPDLLVIGAKIASQCKGLPLTAKIFGGKLSSTTNYDEWKKISNCEIRDLHEERNGSFPPPRWRNNIVFDGSRWICTICSCTFSTGELN